MECNNCVSIYVCDAFKPDKIDCPYIEDENSDITPRDITTGEWNHIYNLAFCEVDFPDTGGEA